LYKKKLKMKSGILLSLIFVLCACGTTKNGSSPHRSNSTEQIFVVDKGRGIPSKCYSKMMLDNVPRWTEVICQRDYSKGLIRQLHADLTRLNYVVDEEEIAKVKFGNTTKKAIKDFQIKNKMAWGSLDWATVNRLKIQ